jgi:hypothetical protein
MRVLAELGLGVPGAMFLGRLISERKIQTTDFTDYTDYEKVMHFMTFIIWVAGDLIDQSHLIRVILFNP